MNSKHNSTAITGKSDSRERLPVRTRVLLSNLQPGMSLLRGAVLAQHELMAVQRDFCRRPLFYGGAHKLAEDTQTQSCTSYMPPYSLLVINGRLMSYKRTVESCTVLGTRRRVSARKQPEIGTDCAVQHADRPISRLSVLCPTVEAACCQEDGTWGTQRNGRRTMYYLKMGEQLPTKRWYLPKYTASVVIRRLPTGVTRVQSQIRP
jgi:hypothetical protein